MTPIKPNTDAGNRLRDIRSRLERRYQALQAWSDAKAKLESHARGDHPMTPEAFAAHSAALSDRERQTYEEAILAGELLRQSAEVDVAILLRQLDFFSDWVARKHPNAFVALASGHEPAEPAEEPAPGVAYLENAE